MKKGKLLVIDGLDGMGKGVFLDSFVEEAKKDGKKVFDMLQYWEMFSSHPELEEVMEEKPDLVITAEPTFTGVGEYIRKVLTNKDENKDGKKYNTNIIANAFALDRHILAKNLTIPFLNEGVDIYQSRCLASSLVYQKQSSKNEGNPLSFQDILSIEGNKFCYDNLKVDFLQIPTMDDVAQCVARLKGRDKHDNSMFETINFLGQIKEKYESQELIDIFTKKGTEIGYFEAGVSIEFSKEQAREFYKNKLKTN